MPVTIQPVHASKLTEADVDRWRAVPVAVAVDLGRDVGQLDPMIRPILPPGQQPRLFGRAVTALCEPPDFGAVLYAADLIKPGDVLMIAASGHVETAMIGEIVGGHVRRRGGVGLVCDGAIRDIATLAGWSDFSVFTRSVTPRGPSSANHGVVNVPVVIGGRVVSPGDLVIGDDDGLIALSPSAIRDRIAEAEMKMAREAEWEARLPLGIRCERPSALMIPVNRHQHIVPVSDGSEDNLCSSDTVAERLDGMRGGLRQPVSIREIRQARNG